MGLISVLLLCRYSEDPTIFAWYAHMHHLHFMRCRTKLAGPSKMGRFSIEEPLACINLTAPNIIVDPDTISIPIHARKTSAAGFAYAGT